MHVFQYLTPRTIDEAISLMESHGERARYIAGGTDVLVKIKEKKVLPDFLISLRHIPDLAYIRHEDARGILRIGSMTTHRMLQKSALIRGKYPILSDAVDNIGSVQIRNVATIGGNIVNAVPSADGAISSSGRGRRCWSTGRSFWSSWSPNCPPLREWLTASIPDALPWSSPYWG